MFGGIGVTCIGYGFNFFIVHFFRGDCSSMRQVGVGGEGMDGREGRAGGMVRRGVVAGGWRRKKV